MGCLISRRKRFEAPYSGFPQAFGVAVVPQGYESGLTD